LGGEGKIRRKAINNNYEEEKRERGKGLGNQIDLFTTERPNK